MTRLTRLTRLLPRGPVAALLATLVLLLGLLAAALVATTPRSPGQELSLDRLSALAAEQQVATAVLRDQEARVEGELAGGTAFWTAYPASDSATAQLLTTLTGSGADVRVDAQSGTATVRLLATVLLPLAVLANLFALLFVGLRGGGSGDVAAFGTVRGGKGARTRTPPAVTYADVAGADDAVTELQEVVTYLTDPGRYAALGAQPPKGVLLLGPPGTGKTLLARATAGQARVAFFSVSGAEFVESLVGVGAARVRDLFAAVRAAAPAILFIDEVDAAGRRRGAGEAGGGSDEREQTLNQLLVEMDGFEVSSGVVVMAATNRADILDPALLRPGRFDRLVTIDAPDLAGRERILALHAARTSLAPDVDLGHLARRTPGFTGADLASVVNEAALLAVRDGRAQVRGDDLAAAVDRVRHGTGARGRVLTDDERHRIAVHEAAHAVVVAATGGDVDKISVLARGDRLGGVRLRSDDADAAVLSESQLRTRLVRLLGGTVGERLVLGDGSTASELDLQRATVLARDLVARYGLSEAIGPVRLLAPDADAHLGGGARLAPVGSATLDALDAEVRVTVEDAAADAEAVLRDRRDVLDALVARLVAAEHVEGAALRELLEPARGGALVGR
ncbi:MAG TPA: ATP-dependent metallopeptidase FtsH/Yme1/Tma family protein [Mycobacteriales bacterium]|nr:ATP-dependent metallopeptidase FtsH/Yme1/Tma family protein [Mycobacteriales bacterium]